MSKECVKRLFYSRRAIGLVALLPLLLLIACGRGGGEPATDFQATLFNGDHFRLSEQIGDSVVVLNFWYPSCPPCRAEMPDFESAWRELQGEDVRFLGLFVPQGLDSEQDARDFVNELGLTYDFATDIGGETARAYQLVYFPTTYFIDREGKVFSAEISVLDADKIIQMVREMARG